MSSSSSSSSSSTSNMQKIKKLFKLKSPSSSRSTSLSTSLSSASLNSPHPSPIPHTKQRIQSSSTITSITSSHCSHSSHSSHSSFPHLPTSRKGSTSGLSTSGLSTAAAFSLSSSNHTILEDSRNSIDSRNRIAGLGLRGSGIGIGGARTRCNSLSSMISIGSLEIEKTETFGVEIEERSMVDSEIRKERRRGKVWEDELGGDWMY